jgi:hypothetical protein
LNPRQLNVKSYWRKFESQTTEFHNINKRIADGIAVLSKGEYNNLRFKPDCPYSFQVNILGLNFIFRSNSPKLINYLKRSYCLFNEPMIIRAIRGLPSEDIDIYFLVDESKKNQSSYVLEAARIIEKLIIKKMSDRVLFLHGASLFIDRKCLVFLGESRSGKTTLASFLKDKGARILSDDVVVLDYRNNRILPFPVFSNIRSDVFSSIQVQYKEFFSNCFLEYGACYRELLFSISEKDFKIYYDYQRQFYDLDNPLSLCHSQLYFIFLDHSHIDTQPTLQNLVYTEALPKFFKLTRVKQDLFIPNLENIMDIFAKVKFYSLKVGELKHTIDLIFKEFLLIDDFAKKNICR